jgi:hypothetical protein
MQVVDGRQALSSKELFGHLLILGELEFVLIENLEFGEMKNIRNQITEHIPAGSWA